MPDRVFELLCFYEEIVSSVALCTDSLILITFVLEFLRYVLNILDQL